jgi:hypothetical protein
MKAAAVFALRVIVLTLVLIIVFIVATNVVGMAPATSPSAPAASTPTDQAQQAARCSDHFLSTRSWFRW